MKRSQGLLKTCIAFNLLVNVPLAMGCRTCEGSWLRSIGKTHSPIKPVVCAQGQPLPREGLNKCRIRFNDDGPTKLLFNFHFLTGLVTGWGKFDYLKTLRCAICRYIAASTHWFYKTHGDTQRKINCSWRSRR